MLARITCMLCAVALTAAPATADFIVSVQEVGSDVVVTGSGSLDLSAWTLFPGVGGDLSALFQSNRVFLGADAFNTDIYASPANFAGPASITVLPTPASAGTGDALGFEFGGSIYLPSGYVSGSPLASVDTYANESLASMGFIAGESYVWTWETASGGQDSFTMNVPEPGTGALLALASLAALSRRRR